MDVWGRSRRYARGLRPLLLIAAAAALCTSCTPRPDYLTITNATDVTLMTEYDAAIGPGETQETSDYGGPECRHVTHLTAQNRSTTVELGPWCDGDKVTVEPANLKDTSASAVVRNATPYELAVSIWQDYGFRDVAVAAGSDLTVTLLRPAGSCLEAKVHAERLGMQPDVVVVASAPLCDGDLWVIDMQALAVGSATTTLVNDTAYRLDVEIDTEQWARSAELPPGGRATLSLGVQPNECAQGSIHLHGQEPTGRDGTVHELRGELAGPFCTGERHLSDADLTHYENGVGWVPLAEPTQALHTTHGATG